jgi:membrane-associated protein
MRDFSTGSDFVNVTLLAFMVAVMGIIGNMFGYWFGKKSGGYLYKREDSLFFKKKYLYQSKEFFDKYGSRAVVFARFLPIVRTFAPVIAGIVEMDRKKFMFYNILGSVLWSVTMIFSGHYLYELFKTQFNIDLKHYIEYIVIGIVLVTTVPVIMKFVRKRK